LFTEIEELSGDKIEELSGFYRSCGSVRRSERERDKREEEEEEDNALAEEGGEAMRGRGRQCTSSSKGKRRNIGHARGKEFLCPKKRDSNAVVSGNRVCM